MSRKTKLDFSAAATAALKDRPQNFAVLKLPADERDAVVRVVDQYLAGELNPRIRQLDIWKEIDKAGVKLTLESFQKYLRARRDGRIKG